MCALRVVPMARRRLDVAPSTSTIPTDPNSSFDLFSISSSRSKPLAMWQPQKNTQTRTTALLSLHSTNGSNSLIIGPWHAPCHLCIICVGGRLQFIMPVFRCISLELVHVNGRHSFRPSCLKLSSELHQLQSSCPSQLCPSWYLHYL